MKGFCLEVSGSFACFTRPEMKVERVSYDVITPSAARAVFDAILWKPAICWQVKKIEVLAPVKWISVRRNEVGKVASAGSGGIVIEKDRQQRAGLFLRDVKYRLHAEFIFVPPEKRSQVLNSVPEWLVDADEAEDIKKPDIHKDETEAKYAAMFERRAKKGQYFHHPYLGCREFPAFFEPIIGEIPQSTLIGETVLGWMLHDMDFKNNMEAKFFRAVMRDGVIDIPSLDGEEVKS